MKKYLYTLNLYDKKRVDHIDVQFLAQDFNGSINMTDLQLQEGSQVTAHQVNTAETLLIKPFNIDEKTFMNTVSNPVKDGAVQPVLHQNISNRFYNFVGRGHQVLSIPNVYHEDYTQELVTTALDLSVFAKNDFDLLRVSTNDGAYIPDRFYPDELYPNHPLNMRYTREFYFDGAKAEQEIDLFASIRTATLNGQKVPFSQGNINVGGTSLYVERQRLMGVPFGSFRLRLEFYKNVLMTEQDPNDSTKTITVNRLFDRGVGFWGTAEFKQYQQKKGVL